MSMAPKPLAAIVLVLNCLFAGAVLSVESNGGPLKRNQAKPRSKLGTKQGYLIVTTKPFKESVAPFVAWKKSLGFQVELIYLNETDRTAEAIRKKISKAYEEWQEPKLDYVLLLGDANSIPAFPRQRGRERYVTDLPYSTLKGEDYFPDLGLGRIPVQKASEAKTVLAKVIRYEKGQFADTDWIARASFITPAAFAKLCEGTSNYCAKLTEEAGYQGTFPKAAQPGGDLLYAATHKARTANLAEAFNQGRGIILYQGHGLAKGWANPNFGHRQIKAIKTADALPFVVSVSCLTGRFNDRQDCIGETWIKHDKGAIAFFGATGNSLFPHCLQMQKGIYDAMFKDGNVVLSEVCDAAKQSIHKKYGNRGTKFMYEMYHVLGDPSMELRLPKKATRK